MGSAGYGQTDSLSRGTVPSLQEIESMLSYNTFEYSAQVCCYSERGRDNREVLEIFHKGNLISILC